MSGLKPFEIDLFYRRLHARGEDTSTLAAKVGVTRSALSRVLNGARRRGPIWRRVAPLLTPEEIALLDVAHRHPWNKKRVLARPRWAKVAAQFQPEPQRATA